ncbi:hypothetical protein SDC9_145234 [bioreactor metagenome]|uniref:Uncharacterized protein n=1 Tax=bioreactor metagenome TaxID=1076179 RepID=A0A645EB94_9ZZZZ
MGGAGEDRHVGPAVFTHLLGQQAGLTPGGVRIGDDAGDHVAGALLAAVRREIGRPGGVERPGGQEHRGHPFVTAGQRLGPAGLHRADDVHRVDVLDRVDPRVGDVADAQAQPHAHQDQPEPDQHQDRTAPPPAPGHRPTGRGRRPVRRRRGGPPDTHQSARVSSARYARNDSATGRGVNPVAAILSRDSALCCGRGAVCLPAAYVAVETGVTSARGRPHSS